MNACSLNSEDDLNGDGETQGLVQFASGTHYDSSTSEVKFTAFVQYGAVGKPIDIEYQLLDGTTVITSGKALADEDKSSLGIAFYTPEIAIGIDKNVYSTKTLTIYLDPSNKVTADEYTSDNYVNLYKKKKIIIL